MPGTAFSIIVEPEVQVLSGALAPYMFRSPKGTVVLQARALMPPDYPRPTRNVPTGWAITAVSRDGGYGWQLWRPGEGQGQGPMIEGAVVQLQGGPIRVFDWIADGPSPEGDFSGRMWDSTDEWVTLCGPIPFRVHLPQAQGGHDDNGKPYSGVTFHRTALQLPDGDLLATIYCWFKEDNVPSSYEPKMNRYRCVLLRSGDLGQNWHYDSTIAADPSVGEEGFDEPVMVQLSLGAHKGRLICLMRTGSRADPLYQAHSDDEGKTWSPPRALPLKGVDPDLIEMADGTLACSFGYRKLTDPPSPEFGNYLAFSTDQGETWGQVTHLPIEAHAGGYRSQCYTSLCEVEPGRLLVLLHVGWFRAPVSYIGRRFVQVRRL